MNAKQRRSSSGAMIRQWTIACFALAITTVGLCAADETVRIDFRNKIPGILDAPVLSFDGVTKLESGYFAVLLVGKSLATLDRVTGPVPFLDAPDSGYLPYEDAQETVISPAVVIGDRIWFLLVILRHFWSIPFGEYIGAGASQPYSMVVTNEVMPLVGLESFSLIPEQLRIIRADNQVIVEWQYRAAQKYELQATGDLHAPIQWLPIFEWSGGGGIYPIFSVTNAVTTTPQFYRLERWE